MTREFLGDAVAYFPPTHPGGKARNVRVGAAFEDDQGRIAIKIDAIPLGDWPGWINVYPRERGTVAPKNSIPEDDIPF